jgi:hypothetical protein
MRGDPVSELAIALHPPVGIFERDRIEARMIEPVIPALDGVGERLPQPRSVDRETRMGSP